MASAGIKTNSGGTAGSLTFGGADVVTWDGTGITSGISGSYNLGRKNFIINGAMNVWQRNTNYALTTSTAYGSADRWHCKQVTAANGVGQQSGSNHPNGFRYSFMLGRTAGSTSTNALQMGQCLETVDSIPLQGKTITVSYYAKAGANYSGGNFTLQIQTGTGTDQSAVSQSANTWTGYAEQNYASTLTTTWTRYSKTVTLGSSITQVGLMFNWVPSGTAGADDKIYITGVQLEISPVATDYEFISYQRELALCQRYFEKSYDDGISPATNTTQGADGYRATDTSNNNTGFAKYRVTKRVVPTTITPYSTTGASGSMRNVSGATDIPCTVADSGANGFRAHSSTTQTAGNLIQYHWTASSEL